MRNQNWVDGQGDRMMPIVFCTTLRSLVDAVQFLLNVGQAVAYELDTHILYIYGGPSQERAMRLVSHRLPDLGTLK